MGYVNRGLGDPGLGFSVRQAFPVAAQVMTALPGVASMRPGGFVYQPPPMPGAPTGPSNEDVLRHVYGSVERGRAMQQASIDEARQRQAELMSKAVVTPPVQPPTPAIETGPPTDYTRDSAPPTSYSPLEPVPEDEQETEGDVIEEVAESGEEGDAEFSGWGCGMGERPVGVTFTRREVQRMGDIRRQQKRRARIARTRGWF